MFESEWKQLRTFVGGSFLLGFLLSAPKTKSWKKLKLFEMKRERDDYYYLPSISSTFYVHKILAPKNYKAEHN